MGKWQSPGTPSVGSIRLRNSKQQERLQDDLVSGLADADIGTATNYVLDLAASGNKRANDYIEIVAGEQLRKDGPEVSAMWAERLPGRKCQGGCARSRGQ